MEVVAEGDFFPAITVTGEVEDRKGIFPPLNQDGDVARPKSRGEILEDLHRGDGGQLSAIPPLLGGDSSQNTASRPPSTSSSCKQRLIGSPPPSAFRRSAARIAGRKWPMPIRPRETPTPSQDCSVKTVSPDDEEEPEGRRRHRTTSQVTRSRNASNDGFREVTFVQALSAPSTAMRSWSRASMSSDSLLMPPPRVVGVSSDYAGALDFVQEVPSDMTAQWGQGNSTGQSTPTSESGDDSKQLACSHGSIGRKEFRLHSIADLVNKHKSKDDCGIYCNDSKFSVRPVSNMGMKTKVYRLKPLEGVPDNQPM